MTSPRQRHLPRDRKPELEREITRVPKGRAIMIPLSDKTAGHGTHTLAAVWKQYLQELLTLTAASLTSGF
jgi:hypothetical protein